MNDAELDKVIESARKLRRPGESTAHRAAQLMQMRGQLLDDIKTPADVSAAHEHALAVIDTELGYAHRDAGVGADLLGLAWVEKRALQAREAAQHKADAATRTAGATSMGQALDAHYGSAEGA